MRRLVLQMTVSVDGYVGGGPQDGGAPGQPEHPDVTAWKLARLGEVAVHVMGRVTYEAMAAHWPTSTDVYAAPMNDLPKVVFSTTLRDATWPPSRVARGDLATEIARLKAESGGDVMAHGGASFVQALSRLHLIDEYRLVTLPVALGSGLPMFKDLAAPLRFDLAEANTFADGTLITVYRTRREAAA